MNVIGTKCMFRKKLNEHGEVVRNTSSLVCKGPAQIKGLYFYETFAHVTRLEAIHKLLAFFSFKKFKIYKMDIKSAFLNG